MPGVIAWQWVIHILGIDYGLAFGHWSWYNFWSGVGGSFLIGALVFIPTWWVSHSCHSSWKCLRHGKYEAAGGMFKLCHRHHPDLKGQKPRLELIHKLHAEHLARIAGS